MNSKYKILKKCLLCNKTFESYISSNNKYCSLSHAYLHRTIIGYRITKLEMRKLSNINLAWIAGFWEGEGTLTIRKKYRNFNISVAQNEKKVIRFIKKLIPSGSIYTHTCKKTIMTSFMLHGIGASLAFIKYILPYIHSQKRKKSIIRFINIAKLKGFKKYVKYTK